MSVSIWEWQSVAIAQDGTTSGEVDIENDCDFLQVIIPTITTGTVKVQVAMIEGGTYYDLGNSQTTVSGTGNYATIFHLGGYRYIKIICSASQAAARTFYVRGRKI